jgi:phage tail tape-measure protein
VAASGQSIIELIIRLKDEASQGVAGLRGQLDSWHNTLTHGQGILSSYTGQLAAMFGVYLGAQGLAGLARGFTDTASSMESYGVRLRVLMGSQEQANAALQLMQDIAAKSPATIGQVVESGTTLQAMGASLYTWLPVLNDLSAVMGMTMPEAASALGRAYAGGIGAADIFRERGINALIGSFAKMKYGIDDLTKVSLPEFRRIMLEAMSAAGGGIAGAGEEMAKTGSGLWSMLSDAYERWKLKIADTGAYDNLKGKLDALLKQIDKWAENGKLDEWAQTAGEWIEYLAGWVERLSTFLYNHSDSIERVVLGYVGLTRVLPALIGLVSSLAAAQERLNVAQAEGATTGAVGAKTTGKMALAGKSLLAGYIGYEAGGVAGDLTYGAGPGATWGQRLGGLAGFGIGAYFGGPWGALAGSAAGSYIGGGIGSLSDRVATPSEAMPKADNSAALAAAQAADAQKTFDEERKALHQQLEAALTKITVTEVQRRIDAEIEKLVEIKKKYGEKSEEYKLQEQVLTATLQQELDKRGKAEIEAMQKVLKARMDYEEKKQKAVAEVAGVTGNSEAGAEAKLQALKDKARERLQAGVPVADVTKALASELEAYYKDLTDQQQKAIDKTKDLVQAQQDARSKISDMGDQFADLNTQRDALIAQEHHEGGYINDQGQGFDYNAYYKKLDEIDRKRAKLDADMQAQQENLDKLEREATTTPAEIETKYQQALASVTGYLAQVKQDLATGNLEVVGQMLTDWGGAYGQILSDLNGLGLMEARPRATLLDQATQPVADLISKLQGLVSRDWVVRVRAAVEAPLSEYQFSLETHHTGTLYSSGGLKVLEPGEVVIPSRGGLAGDFRAAVDALGSAVSSRAGGGGPVNIIINQKIDRAFIRNVLVPELNRALERA